MHMLSSDAVVLEVLEDVMRYDLGKSTHDMVDGTCFTAAVDTWRDVGSLLNTGSCDLHRLSSIRRHPRHHHTWATAPFSM